MLSIIGDIQGENYKKFISFAFEKSDAVLLIYRSYGRPFKRHILEIRRALKPFLLSSRSNAKMKKNADGFKWPGTVTWDEALIQVCVYRLSPEVREYILSMNDLFDWMYPERPEDIAFFSGGECWLSTTAHEKFCDIFKYEREAALLLTALGVAYERFSGSCEPDAEKYKL